MADGFTEAFYEMAALLGIEGAQAASPEQVYREQVKPALEALKQRAANAEEAYLNMRGWAEQNGLDTTARNGQRCDHTRYCADWPTCRLQCPITKPPGVTEGGEARGEKP